MKENDNCTHDCESCGANCPSRSDAPRDLHEAPHALSSIRRVVGIVSGKGGVGKSVVTGLLAVAVQRRGLHAAILDADITGPSAPKIFGLSQKAKGSEDGLLPVTTRTGIDMMSVNLLLDDERSPVVWRGPILAGTVKQFWTDVIWQGVDAMFIDMPPGTGDVPLTVFQAVPLDGIIIVTSPQELVSMIVAKAVNMARMMNIPILGIVENMSYVVCPDCGRQIFPFGPSHVEATAAEFNLPVLGRLPMDPAIAAACDAGTLEDLPGDWLSDATDRVLAL